MILCKKCSWFWGAEPSVSCKFVEPPPPNKGEKEKTDDWDIEPPSNTLVAEGGKVKMCQHPDCFKAEEKTDPVNGPRKIKVRIAGQAQFNSDLNCQRYQRKWWRLWEK